MEDIHVWVLAGGKNSLSAHLKLREDIETVSEVSNGKITKQVYEQAKSIVDEYDICHCTLQIL